MSPLHLQSPHGWHGKDNKYNVTKYAEHTNAYIHTVFVSALPLLGSPPESLERLAYVKQGHEVCYRPTNEDKCEYFAQAYQPVLDEHAQVEAQHAELDKQHADYKETVEYEDDLYDFPLVSIFDV